MIRLSKLQNNRVKRLEMQKYANFDSESASALQYSDCDEYYPIAEVETLRLHDDANYHRLVNLKGPKSPLESQVHSVLLNNEKQSITIDAHSVNSVLLTSLQQVSFWLGFRREPVLTKLTNLFKLLFLYFCMSFSGFVDKVHGGGARTTTGRR